MLAVLLIQHKTSASDEYRTRKNPHSPPTVCGAGGGPAAATEQLR